MKKTKLSRRDFMKFAAAGGVVLISKAAQTTTGMEEVPSVTAQFPSPETYLPVIMGPEKRIDKDFTSMIFLHRSVGHGMIIDGNMRGLLTQRGYQFWDYDANSDMLYNTSGDHTSIKFNIPGRKVEPNNLAEIFSQTYSETPAYPQNPANTLSGLLRHDIIILKSCYEAVQQMDRDTVLEEWKKHMITVRERIKKLPNHVFIILTPPPTHRCLTYDDNALRGRLLANWLMSAEYRAGTANLFVFDLFDRLATPNNGSALANMLRAEFCIVPPEGPGCDSHPASSAWPGIVPDVVAFIDQSVKSYA